MSKKSSYAKNYEAPGKGVKQSNEQAVRKLVAEAVRQAEQVPEESVRSLAPALGRAQQFAEQGLAKWLKTAPEGGDRYTAHEYRKMIVQLDAARQQLLKMYPHMSDALLMGNENAARMANEQLRKEIGRLAQVFDGGEGVAGSLNLPSATRLLDKNKWLLAKFDKSAKRYGTVAWNNIKDKLAASAAANETVSQMVQRIVHDVPSARVLTPEHFAKEMARGIMRGPWAEAERLVRTELADAYDDYRSDSIQAFAEDQAELGREVLEKWDASADRRCELCHALDGLTCKPGGTFNGFRPPRHPYCRCMVIAWMAHWPPLKPLPAVNSKTVRRYEVRGPIVTKGGTAKESRRAVEQKQQTKAQRKI